MKVEVVTATVPAWIFNLLCVVAGDQPWTYALGFGLEVMLGVSSIARRQLADLMAPGADDEMMDVEVPVAFAGLGGWDEDMPLADVVATAAAIVAMVTLDPAAKADFEAILRGEGGLE